MILQALNAYYERLNSDENESVPQLGFSNEKIHYALVLNEAGEIVQISPLFEEKGKKRIPRMLVVPASVKRTAGISPNFAWDNTAYVFGRGKGEGNKREGQCFEAFRDYHIETLGEVNDPGARAMLSYLKAWTPENAPELNDWEDMAGQNIVFQLDGERQYIHERPAIRKAWLKRLSSSDNENKGMCLVTGENDAIAKTHPSIKGVRGAQSSGAALVSFNLASFKSYGKNQNLNAPIGEAAAFNYTTALNHLLSDRRRVVQIGDATTVFWTENASPVETFIPMIFDPPQELEDESGEAEDKALLAELRLFLTALRKGKQPRQIEENPEMKFYVLGLSPNAARVSVRFWHVSTLEEMAEKVAKHFQDMEIIRQFDSDPEYPGMWRLLRETALLRKLDNISPVLAGAFMRAVLTGEAYPQSLLSAVISRIRADQTINYLRASLIKACLVRRCRLNPNPNLMEVKMALDKESTNTAYRLGRLFAVLEKVQDEAIFQTRKLEGRKEPRKKGSGSTIKDRYFGAASTTPMTVFPMLIRLSQHHIKKAKYGYISDEKIEEILQEIKAFPPYLTLEDQGLFALGYYHQRPELFKKSDKENSDDANKDENSREE